MQMAISSLEVTLRFWLIHPWWLKILIVQLLQYDINMWSIVYSQVYSVHYNIQYRPQAYTLHVKFVACSSCTGGCWPTVICTALCTINSTIASQTYINFPDRWHLIFGLVIFKLFMDNLQSWQGCGLRSKFSQSSKRQKLVTFKTCIPLR